LRSFGRPSAKPINAGSRVEELCKLLILKEIVTDSSFTFILTGNVSISGIFSVMPNIQKIIGKATVRNGLLTKESEARINIAKIAIIGLTIERI